jgi:hypothetical protein
MSPAQRLDEAAHPLQRRKIANPLSIQSPSSKKHPDLVNDIIYVSL